MMASKVLDAHIFQYSESEINNVMKIEIINKRTTSSPLPGKTPEGKDL